MGDTLGLSAPTVLLLLLTTLFLFHRLEKPSKENKEKSCDLQGELLLGDLPVCCRRTQIHTPLTFRLLSPSQHGRL